MDESRPPDGAEYRLVTILFADVVGSTAMGSQLGAETYRLIMDRCLRRLNQAIDAFGGKVHGLMGDGLVAFFGAPQAHEDDPVRAALASHRIHESIQSYAQELGQRLQVRIGINTGRVVMGDMGDEIFSEYTGMGMPVNLAARLESAAVPGSTLVGETTARFIRHRFALEPAGPYSLKGFPEPVTAFELGAELTQPLPARGISDLHSSLVGRDDERQVLNHLLMGLEAGRGSICALIAGPGVGKSRLLQEVRDDHAGRPVRWASGRAYSYSQEHTFGVIIDLLADLLDLAADDTPALVDLKLERVLGPLLGRSVGQVWPYLAVLLGAPVPSQYENHVKQLQAAELHDRISSAIQQAIEELASDRPLVLEFEDLHWADQSSVLLIESLMLSTEKSPLAIILVFRPERTRPAWKLKVHAETEFAHRYVELMLEALDAESSQMLVDNLLQATNIPDSLRQLIQQKAEGNPFFVEELIRDLIERKALVRRKERWEMTGDASTLAVPDTVEGVVQARLDRLSPAVRATLQAASVIGRRFDSRLLELIVAEDEDLPQHLLQLERADLIREWARFPEQEYIFKHVLVQETTYRTLLNEQKKTLHRQVGQQLEKQSPDHRDEYAARLAFHFEAAGLADQATDYLLQAGKRAARLGSSKEAANHLQRGLELLRELPKSPDNERRELELLTAYGASLVPVLGYNSEEINATFRHVHHLGQMHGTVTSGPVLRYLALTSLAQAEFAQAYDYGQQLLDLAGRNQDIVSRVEGYYVQGVACYWQGQMVRARQILARAIDSYDPGRQDEHLVLYSQDPRVVCLSRQAAVLWFLGYPDQAVQMNQEALALARKLAHPNSLGIALTWRSWLFHLNGETKATLHQTKEAIAYCQQENLVFWLSINMIFNGWALIRQKDVDKGLNHLKQGLAGLEATNTTFALPYFRSLLAGTLVKSGRFDEGIALLQNCIETADRSGERWCLPEMHRLHGEMLHASGTKPALVEERYLRAIELAREQQARAIELRATTELCQLWQERGMYHEACQMLKEIYNWYSEGFEQEELKKAKMVLDSLSQVDSRSI